MYAMAFQRGRIGISAASATIMLMTVMAVIVPYLYSELRKKADDCSTVFYKPGEYEPNDCWSLVAVHHTWNICDIFSNAALCHARNFIENFG